MISSMSSPYTGYRVFTPSFRMKSTASLRLMLPSRAVMLVRCVMISAASLSPSSKILVIISVSSASRTPCSWPSLTIDMISSSVTLPSSSARSTPKGLSTREEINVIRRVRGRNTPAKKSTTGSIWYPHFSGSLAARRFGMMMPKLMTSTRTNTVTRARTPAHCHQDGFLYHGVPDIAINWAGSAQASTFPRRNLRSTIPIMAGRIAAPIIIPIRWVVTWMVWTNRTGRFTISNRRAAFLFPPAASSSSFPSFTFCIAEPKP